MNNHTSRIHDVPSRRTSREQLLWLRQNPLKVFVVFIFLFLVIFISSYALATFERHKRLIYPYSSLEKIQKLAQQGDPIAQFKLGVAYEEGKGVPHDCKQAFSWYRQAADQDHQGAQNTLAVLYERGCETEPNYPEALNWYQKSATLGNAEAAGNVGRLYFYGSGVHKDDQKAFQWFLKAATAGHAPSANLLGYLYEHGSGTAKNHQEAYKWYLQAAESGNKDAQLNVARALLSENPTSTTYFKVGTWIALAAAQGQQEALKYVQQAHQICAGTAELGEEQINMCIIDASAGTPSSQFDIGTLFDQGKFLPKDKASAEEWYLKAAVQGFAPATTLLARLYDDHDPSVPDDVTEAYAWLSLAVAQTTPDDPLFVKAVPGLMALLDVKLIREGLLDAAKEKSKNYINRYPHHSANTKQ